MTRPSIHGLGAEVALALTAHLLPPPHRLGDARVFTAGRLHLLRWSELGDENRSRVARFLRLRPIGLTEDRGLLEAADKALERRTRFEWLDASLQDVWSRTFAQVPGKPIVRLLDELLDQLEATRAPGAVREVSRRGDVLLRGGDVTYTIPVDHLPADREPWPVVEQAAVQPVRIDRNRLLALADQLDRVSGSAMKRRTVLEERLFSGLTVGPAAAPFGSGVDIPAGPTQLFGAPTGVGKSVLAHLLALDHASRDAPVVLVQPDIKTTLRDAHRLEKDTRSLGLKLSIVPLAGLDRIYGTLVETLEHPPEHDPNSAWAFERLGYYCRLSAYADEAPPAPGAEPCMRLRQIEGKKLLPVVCPFSAQCPKFDTHREAASADIIVINHKALLAGRMRIPMQVGGQLVPRLSMMELVLRRAALILIDEIDQLQIRAVDQGTGSLKLSSHQGLSPLHELLDDFERRRAEAQPPPEVRTQQLRRHIILMRWLPEELSDGINDGWLRWPHRDRMRLSRAKDGWLAARLFGDASDAVARLEGLFQEEAIDEPTAEEFRKVVARWRNDQLDSNDDPEQRRKALMQVLERWPRPLHTRRSRGLGLRQEVASAVILRAVLGRLEEALNFLRPQLAFLDELELSNAARVRDALLGYMTWSPSPLGPLGYRAMGFSFPRHGEQPGDLHVQSLVGDPHGLVAGLGDEVALALAGCHRPVLGLSATARFPGSPAADVLAPLLLARADEIKGVVVEGLTITDPADDGKPIRISGIPSPSDRRKRAMRLGRLLPDQFLREHLLSLARYEATARRARVLLATGSYAEARAVAIGLVQAAQNEAERQRIRYVARQSKDDSSEAIAILPRQIEEFGATGADILVAPLSVVARGHNIVAPGSDHSAISSILVLVRPVPPAEEASRALAHLSYDARRTSFDTSRPGDALLKERHRAARRLRLIHEHTGPFSRLPPELRHEVLCDVLVELAQLAGRARRGNTDVRLYLVDAAFHDEDMGWRKLLEQTFERWRADGFLHSVLRLHGAFLHALGRFADVALD